MGRKWILVLALGMFQGLVAQDPGVLPPDLRAHNLFYLNPSLFNPAYSMDQKILHRIGIWNRWQWQTPDLDPTTLVVNYTGRSRANAYGAGFFQNNTSLYRQTGGYLNYAFDIPIGAESSITFGANLFGFQQEVTNAGTFLSEPILPFSDGRDEFIFQLAPAVQFNLSGFAAAFFSDNLFDFNVTRSGAVTESNEKIIGGLTHYTIPFPGGDGRNPNYLRPILYIKSIPGFDTQFGLNAVWSASKFWLQAGYNSFYGPSAGLGGRFFKRLRLGGVMEFGSENAPEGDQLTFEFMASVDLGPTDGRKNVVGFEEPEETPEEVLEEEARQKALAEAAAARELAEQRAKDSLDAVRRAEELAEAQRLKDSLDQAREAQLAQERDRDVTPEAGERYQEVTREDGLQPGFYLIANVFGTQRYYNAFMKKLQDEGLSPKSFYRSANTYNYVYLRRYDSIQQARQARDSQFGGKYKGELWIFRVR